MADSSLQDAHVKNRKELRQVNHPKHWQTLRTLRQLNHNGLLPHILAGYAYVNLRKIDSAKIELKRAKDLVPLDMNLKKNIMRNSNA